MSAEKRKFRASSGGLKRSKPGVNRDSDKTGKVYVEIIDGVLYVERAQVQQFKAELQVLCARFDYRFVPFDE